ncbi:putative pectin lyase [Lupinus albus]|uniref:Putative pectin lyase n=1 Tax=Lupinus albus TaxID=3870 RepID=A0A6A4NU82_LUPAL|nr:putative pectin lyase [Lupinus albus]
MKSELRVICCCCCLGPGANYTSRASFAKQLKNYEAIPYMNISYIDGTDWLFNYSQN